MTRVAPGRPVSIDPPETTTDRLRGRSLKNVGLLAAAQAIMGAQLAIHIIYGPLVGATLAPNPAWATAPISIFVLANMLLATPISLLHARIGRRGGFLIGALGGALAGLLSAIGAYIGSFSLFLVGSALFGIYQTNQNLFRFAATETAPEAAKPTAMSWVLAGGLASAVIAPAAATQFRDALAPVPIAGVYLAVIGLNLIGALALAQIKIPRPARLTRERRVKYWPTLRRVLSRSDARIAMLCGMISYAMMSLVMTPTSVAMVYCGFSSDQAAWVIGAHVFAMFAPSFITGPLIRRIGCRPVISIGLALLALSGVIAIAGVGLKNFYLALVMLGVGWNFGFIGASTLLTTAYRPEERAVAQGFNDTLVFGLMAVASLGSGQIFHHLGWTMVNLAMAPWLALAALALIWTAVSQGMRAMSPLS